MNSTLIDIIFVLFFVIMTFIGYKKGFVTRLYDLISLVLVFFLTIWLAEPLSQMFQLYPYQKEDIIALTIGTTINYILVMIVTFVVLFLIKKLLGIFLKPVLKKLVDTFSLTEFVDKTLGVILSLIESVLISYFVVLLLITPLYPNGQNMIEQTKIAKHILNVIPSMTQDVQDLQKSYENLLSFDFHSQESVQNVVELALTAQKFGLVSEEQFMDMYNQYVKEKLNGQKLELSTKQKEQIESILKDCQLDNQQIQNILKQIDVSE